MKILKNVLLGKNDRVTNALGYVDTGNTLRCNMTGRYVAVASLKVALDIAPTCLVPFILKYSENPLSLFGEDKCMTKGIHLIFYDTIGQKNQIMLAMDADYMFIDDRYIENKPLIGISPTVFSIANTDRCILLNKYYMKRGKRHVEHSKR